MIDTLNARPLCTVDILLDDDAPLPLGKSPFRNRRVSYIAGGTVEGERVAGEVMAGGGDWSELGAGADGAALTLVDVRSLWKTHDGAMIYVTYSGRLVIPQGVLGDFRDPAKVEALSEDDYYFRIQPTFETADERYGWLNALVAVGYGKRTAKGVRYRIFGLE
ncbi:MAG: DUF3237 domain-containing protein [Alphaproteobacteria bacterium]|nr:DUF3237 domain-containing protein [Alphaproteobacteria bacterium]MBU1516063.1 DUF3237 domain-containing protein [Alphaproteobacteria bacterium]MBU2092722.1 DUF3237 domain-containing protein [Alphaproteobacteria bacterium]MBU2153753.1 DUF3237 domain-containing protein [Alphaproteobacteria bacterium]MBU2308381.1 DUF3237 domain-containing protein [Alphaproteobacteria bacterium]